MSLVEHARTELELLGEDAAYSASIVAAVAAFTSFGHSGGSAMCAVEQLTAILRYETLTDLTNAADEWEDRTEISGTPLWQSKRNPKAFSLDGGQTYYLDSDMGEFDTAQDIPKRTAAPAISSALEAS